MLRGSQARGGHCASEMSYPASCVVVGYASATLRSHDVAPQATSAIWTIGEVVVLLLVLGSEGWCSDPGPGGGGAEDEGHDLGTVDDDGG